MAGPLTWRNVDAPDFRGAARGYEASAAMLGNAFESASKGLDAFGKDRQNTTDEQVLSGLMKINDPKAYQDAVNNTNLTGVSKQALGAIGNRAGQLLQAASTQQDMGIKGYNQDRSVRNDGIDDAARPGVSALQRASATGSQQAVNQVYAQYPELALLGTKEQQALGSNTRAGVSSALGDTDRRFGNTTQQRDDDANQAGIKAADWVQRTTDPNDPVSVQAGLDQFTDPAAKAQAIKTLGYNPYAPGRQAVAGPSAGGGNRAAAGIKGAAMGGGNTFDSLIVQESNGRQFDDNGNVLTSRKGAQGIAQLMPGTAPEAAQLAGLPYDAERVKNDPEYNKALGRAYFNKQLEDFGGDEQKALAAYNAGPGATRSAIAAAEKSGNPDGWLDQLPAETRKYVPQIQSRSGAYKAPSQFGENAADVEAAPISGLEVNASKIGVQDRLAQNQSTGIAADYAQTMQSTDTPGKVATDLIASDFPDGNRGDLVRKLNQIMSDGKVNAATAGAILKRNASPTSTLNPFSSNFRGTSNLGGDFGVNDNGVATDINNVKTGLTGDQVLSNDIVKGVAANIDSAKQGYVDAQAELTNWSSLMGRRPSLSDNDQTPRLQAKVNKARQKLEDAIEKQRQEPAFGSRRARPNVSTEQKNREMNIPDPKSQRIPGQLPDDFGLTD